MLRRSISGDNEGSVGNVGLLAFRFPFAAFFGSLTVRSTLCCTAGGLVTTGFGSGSAARLTSVGFITGAEDCSSLFFFPVFGALAVRSTVGCTGRGGIKMGGITTGFGFGAGTNGTAVAA